MLMSEPSMLPSPSMLGSPFTTLSLALILPNTMLMSMFRSLPSATPSPLTSP